MLNNWIKPSQVEDSLVDQKNEANLASQIRFYGNGNMDLTNTKIAILGIGNQSNVIRKMLYSHATIGKIDHIVDLGNIRKKNKEYLAPVIKEMSDSGITLIIIDAEEIGPRILFDHFNQQASVFNPIIVDECIRDESSPLSFSFLNDSLYKCLEIKTLGCQMHLHNFQFSNEYQAKNLRLGQIRGNKTSIEPFLRNGDFCYFNLNAIRKSDAPGKSGTNPSGLNAEEASQITRYAGLSEQLNTFMVGGFWHIESQTTELIAQMIWYFLAGLSKRTNDKISADQEIQQYVVDLKNPSMSLTFVKSERTGRWWLKLPTFVDEQKIYKHIPCTYQDYKSACNEDVTELIMEAIDMI